MFVYITILWRGATVNVPAIVGESERYITGTCVILLDSSEIVPAVLVEGSHIGLWRPANSTDILTAWRATWLLAKVKRLRRGYDDTVGSLVSYLETGELQEQSEKPHEDFGLNAEEFAGLVAVARRTFPQPTTLEEVLHTLSGEIQNWDDVLTQYLAPVEQMETEGVALTAWVAELVAKVRHLREERRLCEEAEEQEINAPVDPGDSLGQLLLDLGIAALLNPFWPYEEERYSDAAAFDRFVKAQGLGRYGHLSPHIELPVPRSGAPGLKVLFPTHKGLFGVKVGGHKVVVCSLVYDRLLKQFLVDAFVIGHEKNRGLRSVDSFRRQIEKLQGVPFLAGTVLRPLKKKWLWRLRR